MKIDTEKLDGLIQRLSRETTGFCSSSAACIGTVDGKQVQLRIEADDDEFISETEKWKCVEDDSESPVALCPGCDCIKGQCDCENCDNRDVP